MQQTDPPRLGLTEKAAAAYLGVSRQTLARWRRKGVGPRRGAVSRRYLVEDLEAWRRDQDKGSAATGAA